MFNSQKERHLKEINTFVKQGCNKLIISDGKGYYNVIKELYFK